MPEPKPKIKSRIPDSLRNALQTGIISTVQNFPTPLSQNEDGSSPLKTTPTEAQSDNGVNTQVTSTPGSGTPSKEVWNIIDKYKISPNENQVPLNVPPIKKMNLSSMGINTNPSDITTVRTPPPALNNLPGALGKDTNIQLAGDVLTSFGNKFNSIINDVYSGIVKPNPKGIPINPAMDLPLPEFIQKLIPSSYENPRYTLEKNLPESVKNAQLPTDKQFGNAPPDKSVEFVSDLAAGMVPIVMSSMLGISPSIGFPLISEPTVQKNLREGNITQSGANWERAASTMMGGLFELPIAKNILNDLVNSNIKEGTKIGLSKAGDVLFKTIGTGVIDASKQMLQGQVPDMNEVAVNAGTIFLMELWGGHKELKDATKKYGLDKIIEAAKNVAENKPVDENIKSDIENIHNAPITDVRRLLVGPREQRFIVNRDGLVEEVEKPSEPKDMLLTSLQKTYGLSDKQIQEARDRINLQTSNVKSETEGKSVLPNIRDEVKLPGDPQSELLRQQVSRSFDEAVKNKKPIDINSIDNALNQLPDKLPNGRINFAKSKIRYYRDAAEDYNSQIKVEPTPPPSSTEKTPIINEKPPNPPFVKGGETTPEVKPPEVKAPPKLEDVLSGKITKEIKPKVTEEVSTQKTSREQKSVASDNIQPEKQPYEMTFDELSRKVEPSKRVKGEILLNGEVIGRSDKLNSVNDVLKEYHKEQIINAVKDGNEIPPEVIKDYPESKNNKFWQEIKSINESAPIKEIDKNGEPIRSDEEILNDLKDKLKQAKKKNESLDVTEFLNEQMSAASRKSPDAPKFTDLYQKALRFKTTIDNVHDARDRINKNKGKFGLQSSVIGGFNPENLPDYIKIGKFHFDNLLEASKEKAVSFGEWGIKMVKEFGEYIKPHLRKIWTEVQKEPNVTKQELGNENSGIASSQAPRNKVEEARLERKALDMKEAGASLEQIKQHTGKDWVFGENKVTGEKTAKIFNDKGDFPPAPGEKQNKIPGIKSGEKTNLTADESGTTPGQGSKDTIADLKKRYYDIEKQKHITLKGSPDYAEMEKSQKIIKTRISSYQRSIKANELLIEQAQARNSGELNAQVLKRLPDYESKANTEGFTGEDSIERVKALIRKDLLTNKAYQRLGPGQKRKLIISIDEQLKELNKERLQIHNDLGEPFKEPLLRNFFNRTVKTSLKLVEKMGEGGKEFAERMNRYHDRERELMGEPSGLVMETGKLTDDEYKNFTKIRNAMMMEDPNVPAPMNKNVSRINDLFNKYYDNMARANRKAGFITTNVQTGEEYPFRPRKDYDPRVLQITLDKLGVARDNKGEPIMNQRRERQLQFMVESGKAINKAEASDMLDEYINAKTSIGKMGNVEFARVKDIEFAPEMYIQDPIRRMVSYATKISRRIAHSETFGIEGSVANRLLDRIRTEGHNFDFANDLYRYETNNLTPKERMMMEYINKAKAFQTVTKFSLFTSMRNAPQGFLNSAVRGNLKSAVTGFVKAFQDVHKKDAYLSGAIADSIESFVTKEFGGESNFISQYLKWIGFTPTERFNRVVSAITGQEFMKDMLARVKNNSFGKERALREFKKLGLNADEILKRGSFTQDEMNLIERQFAGQTQFNYRSSDLPLAWSSPTGKLLTQWKSWGYQQTKFLFDNIIGELKNKNPFPLMTMLATFSITGEALNTVIDGLRSLAGFNPRKEDKDESNFLDKTIWAKIKRGNVGGALSRLVDDMSGLGAFSMIYDVYRSIGYGKSPTGDISQGVSSVLLGPTVSSIIRLASDITAPFLNWTDGDDNKSVSLFKNIYRNVMTNLLPGGGIVRSLGWTKWLEDKIFGLKINEKEDKYKELKKQGVNIEKLRWIDEKESELKKLHDEAYKTKDKKDIEAFWRASDELDRIKDKSKDYHELQKLEEKDRIEKQKVLERK